MLDAAGPGADTYVADASAAASMAAQDARPAGAPANDPGATRKTRAVPPRRRGRKPTGASPGRPRADGSPAQRRKPADAPPPSPGAAAPPPSPGAAPGAAPPPPSPGAPGDIPIPPEVQALLDELPPLHEVIASLLIGVSAVASAASNDGRFLVVTKKHALNVSRPLEGYVKIKLKEHAKDIKPEDVFLLVAAVAALPAAIEFSRMQKVPL